MLNQGFGRAALLLRTGCVFTFPLVLPCTTLNAYALGRFNHPSTLAYRSAKINKKTSSQKGKKGLLRVGVEPTTFAYLIPGRRSIRTTR